MTRDEYEALIAKLDPNDHAILAEIKRLGRATMSGVRHVTRAPKTGKPMEYGLTRERDRLERAGLIRRVPRTRPTEYEAVSTSAVEEAAREFELRKKRTRKRRSSRQRLVELRAYEHGDYSEFYRVHRRVIELGDYVGHHITRMAFWEAAPKDDLSRVATELGELRDAIDTAFVCLKQRADDDDLLAKIEKLEATNGRTPAERETARSLALRLRKQYDQRVGR
jgi:hypothetical protein